MGVLTGTDTVTGATRLPFVVGLVLVPLMVVPIAIAVGLPALRVRGLHFALITLAAAYAADATLFTSTGLTGFAEKLNVARPEILGVSFASDRAYLVLVGGALAIAALGLRNVGRSRFGRAMRAMRESRGRGRVRWASTSPGSR